MKMFAFTFLFAIVCMANGAHVNINPENHFTDNDYCIDVPCFSATLEQAFYQMTNIGDMKKCANSANDIELVQLVANYDATVQDAVNYDKNTQNPLIYQQERYRVLYIAANTLWNLTNFIQQHLENKSPKAVQDCFKLPLQNAYDRINSLNKCWKKKGDQACQQRN